MAAVKMSSSASEADPDWVPLAATVSMFPILGPPICRPGGPGAAPASRAPTHCSLRRDPGLNDSTSRWQTRVRVGSRYATAAPRGRTDRVTTGVEAKGPRSDAPNPAAVMNVTELRLDQWTMPACTLGPVNPLPPLAPPADLHASIPLAPGIPAEDQRYVGYGRVSTCLPYLMQDRYDRHRRPTVFRTAVLENEILRATFLLDLGGRLWSLLHKPSGRELLAVNPVFQAANLAIRNAWFSGGVEWNVGFVGHSPFTCSPLFASRVEGPDGLPVLRLHEYERVRGVAWQIDAYLPEGSPVLFIRPRITNPHAHEIPMYWWSNIAVPETDETRVVVPADQAYSFAYAGGLRRVPVPVEGGRNNTYPARIHRSTDFFYRIPDGQRPWITALDNNGRGLIQTSTPLLKGRKLFLWGRGPGGRRWQEFLAVPGFAYIEIQAGLARTQAEHVPMPAKADWEWIEAYGLLEADPAVVHGADWHAARAAVASGLDAIISSEALSVELERTRGMARSQPLELLHMGSGWGALEQVSRRLSGDPPVAGPELPFPNESLGEEQAPWLELLQAGALPKADPLDPPPSYVAQPAWAERLELSAASVGARNWLTWLHLGVVRHHLGDPAGAREAWERSLSLELNPWALRNLGVLAREEGRLAETADLLVQALGMRPDCLALVAECGQALLQADRPAEWLDLARRLVPAVAASGRVRLLVGQAHLALGQLDAVAAILDAAPEIEDLREGEVALSDLWYQMHEKRISEAEGVPIDDGLRERVRREFPPPEALDFRMAN